MNRAGSEIRVGPLEVIFAVAAVGLTVFAFLRLGPLEGLCTAIGSFGAAYVLLAVWDPPEAKPPLPAPAEPTDAIAWAVEHDEHRYDPGYWTGGRLHPMLRSSRPKGSGFYLIVGSFITLTLGATAASAGIGGMLTYLFIVGVGGVQLAAGWVLLRRNRR